MSIRPISSVSVDGERGSDLCNTGIDRFHVSTQSMLPASNSQDMCPQTRSVIKSGETTQQVDKRSRIAEFELIWIFKTLDQLSPYIKAPRARGEGADQASSSPFNQKIGELLDNVAAAIELAEGLNVEDGDFIPSTAFAELQEKSRQFHCLEVESEQLLDWVNKSVPDCVSEAVQEKWKELETRAIVLFLKEFGSDIKRRVQSWCMIV